MVLWRERVFGVFGGSKEGQTEGERVDGDRCGGKEGANRPALHCIGAAGLHTAWRGKAFPRENGGIVTARPFQRYPEAKRARNDSLSTSLHPYPPACCYARNTACAPPIVPNIPVAKLACALHVAQSATHGIKAQRLTFNSGPTTLQAPKTPTIIIIALVRRRTSPDLVQ